jgi:2-methylisocitrate lyase-like PEP mutase family enzyme
MADLAERAKALRALHHKGDALVVPNAWDAVSARALAQAGFPTLASSSGAVAWAAGYPDGERMPFEEVAKSAARVAGRVSVPVSFDAEGGYGDIARTVHALLDAGVAGVNLEDGAFGGGDALVAAERHAESIAAARKAAADRGINLWINARTDTFLRRVGDEQGRIAAAVERLARYVEAGADSVFAPGLAADEDIARVAEAVDAPLNVMLLPGMSPRDALARLGVARITVGVSLQLSTARHLEERAAELRAGNLEPLAGALPSQALLSALIGGGPAPAETDG